MGPAETAWSTGLTASPTTSLLDADGTRLALKTGSVVSWLVFDLHGSVVALCSAGTTTLSDAYRYDGFGQRIAAAGASLNPYQYRGLLNIGSDALTWALGDMGARDYSAQLGVFTQADSVQGSAANPLTMNRYLYALANPATLIDPDGHCARGYDIGEFDECERGPSHSTNGSTNQSASTTPSGGKGGGGGTTTSSSGGGGGGSGGNSPPTCDRGCERGNAAPPTGCQSNCATPASLGINIPPGLDCDPDTGCKVLDCTQGTAALGLMGSVQTCFGFFSGKPYTFVTVGVGAMAGAGASGTRGWMVTNAREPGDLGGLFGSAGASASGVVVTGGGDVALGRSDDRLIWTVTVAAGVGAKSLFVIEGHAQGTLTIVIGNDDGGHSSGGF